MSIQVTCPNGHLLHVKDVYAGKVGLCPLCKAQIQIPNPQESELTEEAIMGFLGPPRRVGAAVVSDGPAVWESRSAAPAPPKKSCSKCNREILAETHICPYCHTYIAGVSDF